MNWLRTRRALEQKAANWERVARGLQGDLHGADNLIEELARTRGRIEFERDEARDEICRMRDAILNLAEQLGGWDREHIRVDDLATWLRGILDPPANTAAPTQPASELEREPPAPTFVGADPERLDEAMHRRDYYQHRAEAEANRVKVAEAKASLQRCREAVAVQRQVDARLSGVALPCGCRAVDACYCGGGA